MANIDPTSLADFAESIKQINEAINGTGNTSYATAQKLFEMSNSMSTLSNASKSLVSDYENLIKKIREIEISSINLDQRYLDGALSAQEYGVQKINLANQLGKLKGDISNLGDQLDKELFGSSDSSETDKIINKYQGFFAKLSSLYNTYTNDKKVLEQELAKAQLTGDQERIKSLGEALDVIKKNYSSTFQTLAGEENELLKNLFGDLSKVSKKEIKEALEAAEKVISEYEEKIKKGNATDTDIEYFAKLTDAYKIAQAEVDELRFPSFDELKEKFEKNKIQEHLKSIGTSFSSLGKIFDGLSEKGDDTFSKLGNAFTAVGEIITGVSSIAAGIFQMGSNPVGGIANILGGVISIIQGIGSRLAENKKILKEVQNIHATELTKEIEYNKVMRERLRTAEKIALVSRENYLTHKELIELQKEESKNAKDQLLAELQGEEYISETKYRHGTWFRKAKTWKEYESLAGKSYEEIEKLFLEGKLEGKADTLFKQLQSLHSEQEKLEEELKNLEQQRKETWTGTTTDGIIDSIAQGFIDGKKSAEDFASDFEDMMRNAMLQSIKMKFVSDKLEAWYDDFTGKSESDETLTQDEIDELREKYNAIIENAATQVEAMEKATGLSFATPAETSVEAVAQKGLAAMTQDSADELNGRFSALQMISHNIEMDVSTIRNELHNAAFHWIEIAENTRYCRKLETMESDMKSMKNDINTMALKGIRILR